MVRARLSEDRGLLSFFRAVEGNWRERRRVTGNDAVGDGKVVFALLELWGEIVGERKMTKCVGAIA